MASPGRRELICNQAVPALTGIDFIQVNPSDHRELAVFFILGPDTLSRPVDTTLAEITATITGQEDGRVIAVVAQAWVSRLDASGVARLTLTLMAEADGGFQTYVLALSDAPADGGASRLDPFCAALEFSFKQSCPSPFDCKGCCDCPPEEVVDYPVDYLARDFESFRAALSAFAADRYPDWSVDTPADFGAMVAELFAALGDEFAFLQDGFQREGYLETLRERRSFSQLARLIDYRPDPGQSASGLVVMRLYPGDVRPAGTLAALVDLPPGPHLREAADAPATPLHTHWTDLAVYQPDPDQPCLARGARELVLDNADLLSPPLPAGVLGADIEGYWQGRTLLIETRPDAPDEPVRRHLVTLDAPARQISDPLTGAGPLTVLHWRAEDALPFALDQGRAFVSANLVPVRAGAARSEDFVVGDSADPTLSALPRSLERQGPMAADGFRPVIHRHSLAMTAAEGLDWTALRDAAGAVSYAPEIALEQLDPAAGLAPVSDWTVGDAPLTLAATDEAATVEPGLYGVVATYDRDGQRIVHRDYIGDPGYTLRFGDGTFGRIPTAGDVFRVTWRSGPGRAGNLPQGTITRLLPPDGAPPPLQSLPPQVQGVRNPFALTDGRDPQSLDLARRIAPALFKAETFRAVRNEDYRAQAEKLDWVAQAGAVTRWTGAWATTFVSADPRGAFSISEARIAELTARMGAVRQVGRPVILRQPVFLPLDLKIAVCVTPGFAFGDVARRILLALSPPGGFFDPDRFTFGTPLRRADLEAAVAGVAGVRAVFGIALRLRGLTGWQRFDGDVITAADNRILKIENDPTRPGQGSIRIYPETLPEPVEAMP